MKKFLFFVAIVLLAAPCIKAEPTYAEKTTVEKGVLPKVYSKCYDGNTVSCTVDGEVMNIDGYEFYKE